MGIGIAPSKYYNPQTIQNQNSTNNNINDDNNNNNFRNRNNNNNNINNFVNHYEYTGNVMHPQDVRDYHSNQNETQSSINF